MLLIAGQIYGQTVCSKFIRQKDTVLCNGSAITLTLLDPAPIDSVLPGVWKLLIKGNSIDSNLFNLKPFGFDKSRQYLYSIIHQKIVRFDLKNNSISQVAATNWPGDYTEFTFDPFNNRLLCWRNGRDSVFAIPATGGSWTVAGPGSIDRECFGASPFWNTLTNQPGIYGGYGFNTVKSWIFENNTTGGWQQKKSNPAVDSMPPKGGNLIGSNSDGKKLYLFSGQGSYSGNELAGGCTLGSPWATASGMFCWLRELWELDLSTYTFKNILPVNNLSIQYEGAVSYNYDKSYFYLFGGFQPTNDFVKNQSLPNTNKTFRFRLGKEPGFSVFNGEGDVPAAAATGTNGYAYYDALGKRTIWARNDGICAYYPDSSTIPVSVKSVKWSTGDTASSITVKPLQTSVYKVTRINGGISCSDSIKITIPVLKTNLQPVLNVCADSTRLDAGAGFNAYAWNTGETAQTIRVTQSGTYTVAVTLSGCTEKDSSKVQIAPPIFDFRIRNQKDSVCPGEADSLFIVAPQTGVSYAWYLPGNATVINKGSYYIAQNITKNSDYIVSASSNPPVCIAKSGITHITLRTKFSKPVIHADSISLSTIVFTWDPVPDATSYLVSMDRGNSYSSVPIGGPQGLFKTVIDLLPNQSATITVIALGPYACQTSDSSQLSASTRNPLGNGIYVPNVFTPNDDGVNDVFLVYATAISSIRLMIYNQWGKQIFLSTDMRKGWDGLYNNGKAAAGVYTYALEAIMQDGKRVTQSGSFTLIR